jgi:tartrate-resistant acid phosphatase type 5
MKTPNSNITAPITRREALRRTVLFSAAALAGRHGILRAAPAETKFPEHGLHLLALGDYGSKGDANQVAVADAMATFTKSLNQPLTAVLALGDNFYNRLTPDRFENHFEKIYSPEHLNCPFYVCVGNHDYGEGLYDFQNGKLRMELDYAKNNPHSRWKLPAKWYAVELPSTGKPLVKLIVLDGNFWEGALTPQEKIAQRRYLQEELKKPTQAPWLWVVNHFPLFSDCEKRGDNQALIREWGKLLQEHSVALCLAGHDHTMQHLRVEGYTTNFLVSGAGGAKLYNLKPTDRGFIDNRFHGFNHIHVTPEELHVQFITPAGECLHHFQRDRAGQVKVLA